MILIPHSNLPFNLLITLMYWSALIYFQLQCTDMGKTQTENIPLQLYGVAILSGQAVWYIPAPPPQLLSRLDLIIIVITVTT